MPPIPQKPQKHQKKDLFDDSTMSFGEHLEALRIHLWKALLGLSLCVIGMLFVGDKLIAIVRIPIDKALKQQGITQFKEEGDSRLEDRNWKDYLREMFGWGAETEAPAEEAPVKEDPAVLGQTELERKMGIQVKLNASDLARQLHESYPETYPAPPKSEAPEREERKISLTLWAEEFAQFKETRDRSTKPITLTVQEAFTTYVKVSVVAGLILSAPWVFYQIWMFVAAGLYPHEKRYVHIFLPFSTFLFLAGAVFCFFGVFPFMLTFLLGFNTMLGTEAQIRLSEWISFAIMLPVMFGLSFQLPIVMLFLERISVFEVETYRTKRRMAILVIAIVSMLLTPSPDPMSMILMMVPLLALYELGILLCRWSAPKHPFEAETA